MFGFGNKNIALTDGYEILTQIRKELTQARSTIDIAMAWFTNEELLAGVTDAVDRGIRVRLVLAKNDYNSSHRIAAIKEKGAEVVYLKGEGYGIMHHKFCLIDSRRAITGSFNWTKNAVNNSSENAIFTSDKEIVKPLIEEFNKLLGKDTENKIATVNGEESSDVFISKLDSITATLIEDYDHASIETVGYQKSKESTGASNQLKFMFEDLLTDFKANVFRNKAFRDQTLVKVDNLWEEKKKDLDVFYSEEERILNESYQHKIEDARTAITQLEEESQIVKKSREEANFRREKLLIDKENLELEQKDITIDINPKPFNSLPNYLLILGLVAFWIYLYLFYTSAIYILQFGRIEVERAIAAGVEIRMEFFDPNAFSKIMRKGFVELLFAVFVVHIPIGLSLSKLYVKEKIGSFVLGWLIAVVIVDFFVALSINEVLHYVKVQTTGEQLVWTWYDAFGSLDFYKVFIFGAIPLVMFKLIAERLRLAYFESKIEYVNSEVAKSAKKLKHRISSIDHKINDIDLEISGFNNKVGGIIEKIADLKSQIGIFNEQLEIQKSHVKEQFKQDIDYYKTVYTNYRNNIEKGSANILRSAMESRISSAISGWNRFLNEHFATRVIEVRTVEVQNEKRIWLEQLS